LRSGYYYLLGDDGEYRSSGKSAAFPMLPIPEVARFLERRSSSKETALLCSFRDWVREKFEIR
jgi:hypothetical protein